MTLLLTLHTSISPLPLTLTWPRGSQWKSFLTNSYVLRVIWMMPPSPWDSMRLAVLTASPHKS